MSRLSELFASEHQRLKAYARSLFRESGSVDAEDIIQDVFLATFNAQSVSPIDDTLSYIYRAISNRIIDLRRKKGGNDISGDETDDEGVALVDSFSDSRTSIESCLQNTLTRDCLFAALAKLGELEQKIIIENEFESKSFAELSKETGIAVGTLLSKKSRAMKKLAALLENGDKDSLFE